MSETRPTVDQRTSVILAQQLGQALYDAARARAEAEEYAQALADTQAAQQGGEGS